MADDASKSPVTVDVGASLKAEVTTEIPTESSGRLLDALTDIIRPFSEKRGFRADQIRLQREDVLIQIAEKAKKRLALEGVEPRPVPSKFMVPFLEKASCEDVESEMVERWANLLASATQHCDGITLSLLQILTEIGPDEVRLIEEIAANQFGDPVISALHGDVTCDFQMSLESEDCWEKHDWQYLCKAANTVRESEAVAKLILEKADSGSGYFFKVGVWHATKRDEDGRAISARRCDADGPITSMLVLERHSLVVLDKFESKFAEVSCDVYVARPTSLAIELVRKCSGKSKNVQ